MELWRQNDYGRIDRLEDISMCRLKKIVPAKRLEKIELKKRQTIGSGDTVNNKQQQQEQPLLTPEERKDTDTFHCSCMNPAASRDCCQRVVRRTHKQGYVLTRELFNNKSYPGIDVTQSFRTTIPVNTDYRDVIITRDWYESIVSG